ncbi:MAG: tetratricopeptide repeat protein [Pseudomonadota bacterium]
MPWKYLCLSMIVGWISPLAFAQFGPTERETPRSAEEILADRAMTDAALLLQSKQRDIITADDGIDIEQAQRWYNTARANYTTLCDDRNAPKDVWVRNCYKLADIYRRGLGVAQDYDLAETLYRETCTVGGLTDACLQQAYIDHTGPTGDQDWSSARELYTIACNRRDMSGCAGLGNMLYRGQGGPIDRDRGARLLQDACAAEYDWACDRLRGFGLTERSFR